MQNLVIPNKDNLVVYTFSGVDLTLATDIQVQFGAESYSLVSNPTIVIVTSATELSLNLSATAEVGKVYSTVTYFDGASVNGTDITSRALGNSDQIVVAIGSQLIIEDGSIVANANSFATDTELKAYADLRGLSLPATQPEREALLLLAMDYLKSVECKMQGHRVAEEQALSFPRYGVMVNGFLSDSNQIPSELKIAQMEAAITANEQSLLVNSINSNVQSEKVDVLETSYFKGGKTERVNLGRVNAYLTALLVNTNKLVRT